MSIISQVLASAPEFENLVCGYGTNALLGLQQGFCVGDAVRIHGLGGMPTNRASGDQDLLRALVISSEDRWRLARQQAEVYVFQGSNIHRPSRSQTPTANKDNPRQKA